MLVISVEVRELVIYSRMIPLTWLWWSLKIFISISIHFIFHDGKFILAFLQQVDKMYGLWDKNYLKQNKISTFIDVEI